MVSLPSLLKTWRVNWFFFMTHAFPISKYGAIVKTLADDRNPIFQVHHALGVAADVDHVVKWPRYRVCRFPDRCTPMLRTTYAIGRDLRGNRSRGYRNRRP